MDLIEFLLRIALQPPPTAALPGPPMYVTTPAGRPVLNKLLGKFLKNSLKIPIKLLRDPLAAKHALAKLSPIAAEIAEIPALKAHIRCGLTS